MPIASSSWFGRSNPSSINTSAIRSPKDLLLIDRSGVVEPVDGLQRLRDRRWPRQIPRDRVVDRLLDRIAAAGIKRIAARHHHRAADEIERDKQTPEREIFGQHRRDLPVSVVIFEG